MVATVQSVLRTTLPNYQSTYTTINPSEGDERISLQYLSEWAPFRQEIINALAQYGDQLAGFQVYSNSDEPEKYLVGNEIGVTARLIQNLCIPLNRAWEACGISLSISDYQAAGPLFRSAQRYPDLIILGSSSSSNHPPIRAPIEVKPPWTLLLEQATIISPEQYRHALEVPLGKRSLCLFRSQLIAQQGR